MRFCRYRRQRADCCVIGNNQRFHRFTIHNKAQRVGVCRVNCFSSLVCVDSPNGFRRNYFTINRPYAAVTNLRRYCGQFADCLRIRYGNVGFTKAKGVGLCRTLYLERDVACRHRRRHFTCAEVCPTAIYVTFNRIYGTYRQCAAVSKYVFVQYRRTVQCIIRYRIFVRDFGVRTIGGQINVARDGGFKVINFAV